MSLALQGSIWSRCHRIEASLALPASAEPAACMCRCGARHMSGSDICSCAVRSFRNQSALACCGRNSCSSNIGRVIVAHADHRRSSSLNTFTTFFFRDEKRKHLTMSKSGPFFLELGVADRRWTMTMTMSTRSVSSLYTKR